MTDPQSLVERLAGEAGAVFETAFESVPGNPMWLITPDELDTLAKLMACDLEAAWQEAHGFDKHGVGEFIRQRFGVGE